MLQDDAVQRAVVMRVAVGIELVLLEHHRVPGKLPLAVAVLLREHQVEQPTLVVDVLDEHRHVEVHAECASDVPLALLAVHAQADGIGLVGVLVEGLQLHGGQLAQEFPAHLLVVPADAAWVRYVLHRSSGS